MTPELSQYLEQIRENAKLEHLEEDGVLSELEAHIEDALEELTNKGFSEEEAIQTCLARMGSTRLIARHIYEAHSQGSWQQVILSVLPHIIFALLFALNWWHYPGWLTITLLLTLATTVYGWLNNKSWAFSWLGVTMVPVLAMGILLLYLPRVWSLLALVVYFPLALWWIFRIVMETVRRDWIFGSLALVPLPIIGGWFLSISPDFTLSEAALERATQYAPLIALSFLALAFIIAAIIRIRQRWLRIAFMVTSGVLTLSWVVYYAKGGLGTTTFFGMMLVMWGVFLFPPLFERFLRKGKKSLWKTYRTPPASPGASPAGPG